MTQGNTNVPMEKKKLFACEGRQQIKKDLGEKSSLE